MIRLELWTEEEERQRIDEANSPRCQFTPTQSWPQGIFNWVWQTRTSSTASAVMSLALTTCRRNSSRHKARLLFSSPRAIISHQSRPLSTPSRPSLRVRERTSNGLGPAFCFFYYSVAGVRFCQSSVLGPFLLPRPWACPPLDSTRPTERTYGTCPCPCPCPCSCHCPCPCHCNDRLRWRTERAPLANPLWPRRAWSGVQIRIDRRATRPPSLAS